MLQRGTELAAILALSLVLAACGGSAATPTPTPTPAPTATATATPTPAGNASGDAASAESMEVAEHIREKTMRLWDVYNTYDVDALSAFYSEDYWGEEEEEVRSNIKPFESRGLTFTAEETSPPTEIAPGQWEIKHTARFHGGLVNMVFVYEQFGEDWLLTYAKPE